MFTPGPSLGVDTEIVAGDKEEKVETNVGDSSTTLTTQKADTINNVQDIPLMYILLFTLMAGWAIPDPATMGRGFLMMIRALLPFGGNR